MYRSYFCSLATGGQEASNCKPQTQKVAFALIRGIFVLQPSVCLYREGHVYLDGKRRFRDVRDTQ